MIGEFRIRFEADDAAAEIRAIEALCMGAAYVNATWIARNDGPACLGCEGVRYELPATCNEWCQHVDTAPIILRKKLATCIAVAAYVAGWEIAHGRDAEIRIVPLRDSYGAAVPRAYHALVQLDDGAVVDPTEGIPGYRDEAPCPIGGVH